MYDVDESGTYEYGLHGLLRTVGIEDLVPTTRYHTITLK